jgi:hypothetical protein
LTRPCEDERSESPDDRETVSVGAVVRPPADQHLPECGLELAIPLYKHALVSAYLISSAIITLMTIIRPLLYKP